MSKIRIPVEIAESLKTKILNMYNVCDEGLIKGLIAQALTELDEYYKEEARLDRGKIFDIIKKAFKGKDEETKEEKNL